MERSFTVGEWVHVVLTWSRENRIGKLYKNGNKTGEAIADPNLSLDLNPTGSKAFDIGLKGDTGHSFHGYIRDLMVFDRAISDAELNGIFSTSSN